MIPAGSLLIAVSYGAGLLTGLARFPDPLSAGIAAVAGAMMARSARGLAIAVALLSGLMSGFMAQRVAGASCAATIGLGEIRVQLKLVDPGWDRGRVRLLGEDCHGELDVRWPRAVRVDAGMIVTARARWIARPGLLDRPGGMLVVRQVESAWGEPDIIDRSRTAVATATTELFGSQAGLVDALVAGRRGGISHEIKQTFVAAGMIHLLAISGFHIALVAGWVLLLGRLCGMSIGRSLPLAAMVATCYVAWLGWPIPATRAAGLLLVASLCRLRQRSVRPEGIVGASALMVLIMEPWSVVDLGAWLSFAAVVGVSVATRWWRRNLGRKNPVGESIAASVGATMTTSPIAALTLGQVAPVGIVLNLAAIPLTALAVPSALVAISLHPFLPGLAAGFAQAASVMLEVLQQIAIRGATLPGAGMTMEAGLAAAAPWIVLLFTMLVALRPHAGPREAIRRVLWGSALLIWWPHAVAVARIEVNPEGLALHFLDVGQGDAIALRTPGGHWMVIDAGPADRDWSAGQRVVVPFLKRHGARSIAVMIVSHAHRDHVGGAEAVLRELPVGLALDPGEPFEEESYGSWLQALGEQGVRWQVISAGSRFTLDGVTLSVLHPGREWPARGNDLNEDSVVLLVSFGDFSALLTGDAGIPAEVAMAAHLREVDLLKVGHHGSRGSTGAEFLRQTAPQVAIVSVGRNGYGHPAPEAMARLHRQGSDVWRTDQEGTISVVTDGITFTVHGGRHRATHSAQ